MLLELLKCNSKPCEIDINNVSMWLYDGMAETMAELARLLFLIIMKHRCNKLCVDFIYDRYSDVSI